ncbi:MAG: penicillin-binding protein 2, partial [Rubrivivax sp.]|nr:penicillin-binding protein 2 [Rubrivivax sp.]
MSRGGPNSVRSVNYATSPLLASKTPPLRSRFVVVLVGAAFLVLLGRAVHVQIVSSGFYQAEGEKRFVHKQPLPASRGRIVDRNGQLLATSVAVPSVWMIPRDFEATPSKRLQLVKLLGMSNAELEEKLAGSPKFAWLRR